MSPQQTHMIRTAVDGIRVDHPKLFAVISATYCTRNLAEARRALNYLSADDFTIDYHQALEHLTKRLRDAGYKSPAKTDQFEDRITWQTDDTESKSDTPKLPSQEVVDRWYRGHILHEAIGLITRKSRTGLYNLWERFPNRREEIEIAFVLAQPQRAPARPLRNKLPQAPNTPPSRLLPAIAGILALMIILLMALSPPNGNRAISAIATSFEDAVLSSQGIFDFSESALAKAEAPGNEPEPPPSTTTASAPEPPPRPEIALPNRPKIEMAALPKVPRQIAIPTTRVELKAPPRVSAPTLDRGTKPSTYFGSRPNVKVARPTLSLPTRGPATLPSGILTGQTQTTPQATASDDLKGYRPAGRIGFSSFQTSGGLAGELVRLTRIERALSRLKKPRERNFEGAQLALAPDRARIHFADGIAFSVTFRFGRLDDIQIYARSGIDKKLHTETEARRGIRFLDRVLSNS